MVVPKAAIYQTQTFYAKGKMKEVKQLVANLRGESLSSGKTETWSGKMLKIPPVSPSILDCSIIRVEYSLMVSRALLLSCLGHTAGRTTDLFPFATFPLLQRSLASVSSLISFLYHNYSVLLSEHNQYFLVSQHLLCERTWLTQLAFAKSGLWIAPGVISTCC